MQGEQLHFL